MSGAHRQPDEGAAYSHTMGTNEVPDEISVDEAMCIPNLRRPASRYLRVSARADPALPR